MIDQQVGGGAGVSPALAQIVTLSHITRTAMSLGEICRMQMGRLHHNFRESAEDGTGAN
jgi:hypothetical protein